MAPPAPAAHLDAFPDLTYADLDFPLDDLGALSMSQVALMPYHLTATDAQKLWAAHKFYKAIGQNRIGKKDGAALLDIKDEGEDPDDCIIIDYKPAVAEVQGGPALDAVAGTPGERVRRESLGQVPGEQLGRDDTFGIAESVRKAIALAAEAAGASQGETSEGQRRNDFFEGPRGGSQWPYTDQRSSQRRTREDSTESRSKRRRSRSPRRESSSRRGSTSHRSPHPSSSHGQDRSDSGDSRRRSDRRHRDDSRLRTSSPAEQYLAASVPRPMSTEQPLSEVQRGKRPEGVHRHAVVERPDSMDPWDNHTSFNYSSSARDDAITRSSAPAKRVVPSASSSPLAARYSLPLPTTNAAASVYHTPFPTSSRPSPAPQFTFITPSKESSRPTSTGTEPRQLDTSTPHDFTVPHRPSPDHQLSERQRGKRPEVHPALPSSGSESPDAWSQVVSRPLIAAEEPTAMDTNMALVLHANPPPATFDRRPSSFLTPLHKSESRTPPPLVERERFGKVHIPFTVAYLGLPGNCTLALLSHHLALSSPSLSPPPMALTWVDGFSDAPSANTKIAIGAYTSASENIMIAKHHFLRPLALFHPKRWIESVAITSLREFTWDQCCDEVQSTYKQTGSVPNYERDRGGPVAVLVREGLSQEYIDEVERIAKGDRVGKWKAGWGIEEEEEMTLGTQDWRKERFAMLLDVLDENEEEEEEEEAGPAK